MPDMPAWLRRCAHLAEVGRWRLSKALGVPGLERLRWGCIGWGALAIATSISGLLDLFGAVTATRTGAVPPAAAWINIWVQIGIMIVAALVSYAMRPRVQPPQPAQQTAPVAEDGTAVREVFGEVWINNPMQLLWRALEPIEIRKRGGKK